MNKTEKKEDNLKAIHCIQPSPEELYSVLIKEEQYIKFHEVVSKLKDEETKVKSKKKEALNYLEELLNRMEKIKAKCESKKGSIKLYGNMIQDLKSEIHFLRELNVETNRQLQEDFSFLRNEIKERNALIDKLVKAGIMELCENISRTS